MYHLPKGRKRMPLGKIFGLRSLSQFQICLNLHIFFRQMCIPNIPEFTKKMVFPGLAVLLSANDKRLGVSHMLDSKNIYFKGIENIIFKRYSKYLILRPASTSCATNVDVINNVDKILRVRVNKTF